MKTCRISLLLVIVFTLSGCVGLSDWWNSEKTASTSTHLTAEQLYAAGDAAVAQGEYTKGLEYYQLLEANYPFSDSYERALRGMIYAHHAKGDAAATAAVADRYIRLYPRAQHVDYAYYMKGMANFEPERGVLARYFSINQATRDSVKMPQAYNDFALLVQRFPKSNYAADAQQRMLYLRNLFAEKELSIAEFYMDKRMYVAASNRASALLQNYSQSPSAKRALEILVEANTQLGLVGPAEDAQRVFDVNFAEAPAAEPAQQ